MWVPFSKSNNRGNFSMNSKLPPQSNGAPATSRGERHSYKRPSLMGNRTSSIGCLGQINFERKTKQLDKNQSQIMPRTTKNNKLDKT
jgi:hypothetical protein